MKNKAIVLLLTIILSLSLLTGCQSGTSSAVSQTPSQTENHEEQLPEEAKATAEPAQQISVEAPAESLPDTLVSIPAEEKPVEPEKPAGENQKTQGKSEEAKSDKSTLHIEGSGIENPVNLSLDELKAMKEAYYEDDFFSLNSYGTKEYFHFKGVRIKALLDKAGLKGSASIITFVASDGYKHEMTIEEALKEDYIDEQDPSKKYPVIIAWHENGNDYDPERGAPFRLVIGQKEPGDVNKPQWVQNIAKIIIE